MKTKISLVVLMVLFLGSVSSQVNLGGIKGKILDDKGNPIPGAKVWVEREGSKIGSQSQLDGRFKIDALEPGIYLFVVKSMSKDTFRVHGVEVRPDEHVSLGTITMLEASNMMKGVDVPYVPSLLHREIERLNILTEDIEHSLNKQNPLEILKAYSSDINIVEGTNQVIIRGSRPGDAIFYIDGVKSTSMAQIPGASIRSISAYTGGIPAKYGDTTGGVIILETKSYFSLYYSWKARQ